MTINHKQGKTTVEMSDMFLRLVKKSFEASNAKFKFKTLYKFNCHQKPHFVIIEGFQSRSDKSPVSILSQDLWRLKDISQRMFQVFFIYVTIQVLTAKSEQLFSGQRVFKRWSIYFISKFINN